MREPARVGAVGIVILGAIVSGCDRTPATPTTAPAKTAPPAPAAAASAPAATAPKPPAASVIRGGAWLTRADGHSDLLRGLRIAVVRQRTSGTRAGALLGAAIDKANRIVAAEKAGRDRVINGARVMDNVPTELEKARAADADRLRSLLDTVNAAGGIDPTQLRTVADETTRGGVALVRWADFLEPVAGGSVGVEGKFEITGVPPGDYYLCAVTSNTGGEVEWVVPIHCNAGTDIACDLSNENASRITPRP